MYKEIITKKQDSYCLSNKGQRISLTKLALSYVKIVEEQYPIILIRNRIKKYAAKKIKALQIQKVLQQTR